MIDSPLRPFLLMDELSLQSFFSAGLNAPVKVR